MTLCGYVSIFRAPLSTTIATPSYRQTRFASTDMVAAALTRHADLVAIIANTAIAAYPNGFKVTRDNKNY